MAIPSNYSNRSSAHEWFRHSEDPSQQEVKQARLGDSAILLSEKLAAQDLRDQVLQKQQQRDQELKRDQEECKAITKRERELLEEQNRKESELRERQRQQLKNNLDQQLEEKRALKAKEAEEANRYWVAQQNDLAAWKQTQEEDKARRALQSKHLQQERLEWLAKAEQKKTDERQKKLEYQKKLTENFTNFVEQQEANRKKQFTQAGAGILSGTASAASSSSAPSSASDVAFPTYSLMQQIEERRKAKELQKQAEKEYALKIQQDVADAKREEELKQRKIREKNMLYKSYLEQQMSERAKTMRKTQEDAVNTPAFTSQGSNISGTRPW